ncbi:MAG: TonB-dependent receptor [Campylobacterales bacterium]
MRILIPTILLSTALFAEGYSAKTSSFKPLQSSYEQSFSYKDIENSNTSSLSDFLNKYTSIDVYPSFGNDFAPKIATRGYGITNGYQNIAIEVDGVRIRSIDSNPIMLSSIPLASISKIVIKRGYGSIESGEGSSAAVVEITTKNSDFIELDASFGSYNTKLLEGAFLKNIDKFYIGGSAKGYFSDGSRDIDSSGDRDNKSLKQLDAKAGYKGESFSLGARASTLSSYLKYANSMTKSAYDDNPSALGTISGAQYYSDARYNINDYGVSLKYYPSSSHLVTLEGDLRDKTLEYVSPYPSTFKYDNDTLKPEYTYFGDGYSIKTGVLLFRGDRDASTNKTSKDLNAIYVKYAQEFSNLKVDGGVRYEEASYDYNPNAGSRLSKSESENSYVLKLGYMIAKNLETYISYDRGVLMPNIDMFFTGSSFNDFINPQIMDTYQLGSTYQPTKELELKGTIFYIKGDNEIYYYNSGNWLTSYNTNLDKTEKKGVELEARYDLENLSIMGMYSYIDATIKKENEANGAYDGNTLPGVYKNNFKLGATYMPLAKLGLEGSFNYRSDAYNSEDFLNSGVQKEKDYLSLDMGASYKVYKDSKIYAEVTNITNYKNAYIVGVDRIYPYNFETTYKIGAKVRF